MLKSFFYELCNQLFYVGFGRKTITRVQPQIHESNRHTMNIYSPLATTTLLVLSVCSFYLPFMAQYRLCYVCAFLCSALSLVLLLLSKGKVWLLNASITVLISSLLVFGVFTGTVFDPNNTSTSFVALLFAIPLLFCLRPLYSLFILLINDSLFFYLCINYKAEAVIYNDMLNIVPFSIVSFMISLFITRNRVRQFILENELTIAKEEEAKRNQKLEYYCNNDVMTNLGNFFSYQRLVHHFNVISEDTYTGVLFADLNRLKYINDHQGHDVGNEYISSFAKRLKSAFPDCDCFRLSGDEFLVVGMGMQPEDFLPKAAAFKADIDNESIPMASIGYLCEKVSDLDILHQSAEQKMYEDKLAFYQHFPEFKR